MSSDIIMHRHRDRVVCIPGTPKGVEWIRSRIVGGSTQYSISEDLADEVAEGMRQNGLEVDVK